MIADMIAALRARWRLELAILLAVLVAVAAWAWVTPKSYAASASLLYDIQQPEPVADRQAQVTDDSLLGTQADIIRSEAIAQQVVRSQNLRSVADLVDNWQRSTGGTDSFEVWLGRLLVQNVTVAPVRGSRVLTISYRSPDPYFAAQMANAFAATYIDERLRLQTDPAKTYTQWFEERTADVRETLGKAQEKLAAFQRRTGIVDSRSLDAEGNRLTELSGQLVGAEASASSLRARAGQGASQSIDVQSSAVVQGLRSQIAGKSAQIEQMQTELGPNHPTMIAARAELSQLQSKLSEEIGNATRALQASSGAASSSASSLRGMVGEQRGRMLALAADRSELEGLQRDVDSARAAYDAVTQRLLAVRLQSSVPSTNVRQLDQATPPLFPNSPNIPLRIALGLAFGILLAVGVAALLEYRWPRVRTPQGLESTLGIPILSHVRFSGSSVQKRIEAMA